MNATFFAVIYISCDEFYESPVFTWMLTSYFIVWRSYASFGSNSRIIKTTVMKLSLIKLVKLLEPWWERETVYCQKLTWVKLSSSCTQLSSTNTSWWVVPRQKKFQFLSTYNLDIWESIRFPAASKGSLLCFAFSSYIVYKFHISGFSASVLYFLSVTLPPLHHSLEKGWSGPGLNFKSPTIIPFPQLNRK